MLQICGVSLILFFIATHGANLAQAQDQSPTRELAAENDTVWVVLNHIKPDKRDQFEQFIEEIFWPEAKRLSEADQRVFRQTRVLYPTEPEADGTYTYFFIMDPVISGADYGIENFLRRCTEKRQLKNTPACLARLQRLLKRATPWCKRASDAGDWSTKNPRGTIQPYTNFFSFMNQRDRL